LTHYLNREAGEGRLIFRTFEPAPASQEETMDADQLLAALRQEITSALAPVTQSVQALGTELRTEIQTVRSEAATLGQTLTAQQAAAAEATRRELYRAELEGYSSAGKIFPTQVDGMLAAAMALPEADARAKILDPIKAQPDLLRDASRRFIIPAAAGGLADAAALIPAGTSPAEVDVPSLRAWEAALAKAGEKPTVVELCRSLDALGHPTDLHGRAN
jgi:hypothetical protein